MGLIFDIHGWRGLSWERDLLHWKLVFAFFTVMLCRFCVTDRLAMIADALSKARASLEAKNFDHPRDKSEREGTK